VRVLVLGGTIFLGRHVVEAALARGNAVTTFNRGRHPDTLPADVERLHGDRDGGLDALAGREWDTVVDTSGYFPRIVRASAERLADRVGHYVFVSSASVYADTSRPGVDESAPMQEIGPDAAEELSSPEAYGGFKARCEAAVEEVLPGRALSVRAGLIVGPHDPTNRFTYWVTRLARGGDVLAPEPRDQSVQLVDGRDLAAWMLDAAERRIGGVLNATGPERPLTFERFLEELRAAVGPDARLAWADERFLLKAGVEPWQELPLWLAPGANPGDAGFLALDVSQAIAARLGFRPLAETARDTLAWAEAAPAAQEKDVGIRMAPAGLDAARERELLEAWRREAA
jgi:2'-hydroxyisoflavone reductase